MAENDDQTLLEISEISVGNKTYPLTVTDACPPNTIYGIPRNFFEGIMKSQLDELKGMCMSLKFGEINHDPK